MSRTPLPEFVIIGAAKSATTWLAQNLQAHPQVFIPGPEPHYFSTEFHRGQAWYESWFEQAPPDRRVGEKSADYLAHPEAPRRIAKALPHARLIVQLRNPIERAYSDYCMFFRRGHVTPDPECYLDQRFSKSVVVTGPPGIRFFVGTPITVHGQPIGALQVFGPEPRTSIADGVVQQMAELMV